MAVRSKIQVVWLVLSWSAITAAALVATFAALRPRQCSEVQDCREAHEVTWNVVSRYSICALGTSLILEVAALRLTWKSAQALVGIVRGIENTFVPPVLLCVAFIGLILENLFVANLWFVQSGAPGVGASEGRPVYSAIILEWVINVPILLVLCGHCALGRPLTEVSRPLVVTNLYMILAWASYFIPAEGVRWVAIVVAFAMYSWASYDMAMWVRQFRLISRRDLPARDLRCRLTLGLIFVFLVYGLVFLAGQVGFVNNRVELLLYISMNVGVKLVILLVFVGIRSSQLYDLLVGLLANKQEPFERQVAVMNDFGDVEYDSTLPFLQ